jgi:hypothetical protein
MIFAKFNRHPNFILYDFLADVVPFSNSHGYQRSSRMNYIYNEIVNSLIGQ